MLNLQLNYLGVAGGPFKSSKILRVKNAHDRLLKAFDDGGEFKSLELYSLPGDYQIAAYDYDLYVSRTILDDMSHILITTTVEYFDHLDSEKVIDDLKQFIHFRSGSVFELSNMESPQLYVAVENSGQSFHSLQIIRELE